jgi:hypothetical protein
VSTLEKVAGRVVKVRLYLKYTSYITSLDQSEPLIFFAGWVMEQVSSVSQGLGGKSGQRLSKPNSIQQSHQMGCVRACVMSARGRETPNHQTLLGWRDAMATSVCFCRKVVRIRTGGFFTPSDALSGELCTCLASSLAGYRIPPRTFLNTFV